VSSDVRAFYSNSGAVIDVVAPGGDCGVDDHCNPNIGPLPPNAIDFLIFSTDVWPLNEACAQTQSCTIGWFWQAGTSMAAPHVSGVAALMRGANPSLRPNQLIARVRQTAEGLGDRQVFGHGMVDALAAASR
jgi:lantibiotic leader peptide-processing serine protease